MGEKRGLRWPAEWQKGSGYPRRPPLMREGKRIQSSTKREDAVSQRCGLQSMSSFAAYLSFGIVPPSADASITWSILRDRLGVRGVGHPQLVLLDLRLVRLFQLVPLIDSRTISDL